MSPKTHSHHNNACPTTKHPQLSKYPLFNNFSLGAALALIASMANLKRSLGMLIFGICASTLSAQADSSDPFYQCYKDGTNSQACHDLKSAVGGTLGDAFDNLKNVFRKKDDPGTLPHQFLNRYFPNIQYNFGRAETGEWPQNGEQTASADRMVTDNVSNNTSIVTLSSLSSADPEIARGTGY